MKIKGWELNKAQRGWICSVWFTQNKQFTDEYNSVTKCSKYWLIAIIKAYISAKRYVKEHTPKPSEE